MKYYVEFKTNEDKDVYINARNVCFVRENLSGALIEMISGSVNVIGSAEEVARRLDDALIIKRD